MMYSQICKLKSIFIFLFLIALGGCESSNWLTDEDEKLPAELTDIESEIEVERIWSYDVEEGQGENFIRIKPVVDGDKIFAAGNTGEVVALDRNTGKKIWDVNLEIPIGGGVGAGYGLVLVGSLNGDLLALNQKTGALIWQIPLTSEALSAPQINNDIVVVQTIDDKVSAYDRESGARKWIVESTMPVLTQRGTSTPILTDRFVIAGFSNGKINVISAQNGMQLWNQMVSKSQGASELDRLADVDSTPLLFENILYVAGYQGSILAIDAMKGRKLWRNDISTYTALDEGFGNIYVSDENSHLYAFNQSNGSNVWLQANLENRKISAPKSFNNYVVVGDFEGYLHFMSQVDGRIVARKQVDSSGVRSAMITAGNTLYVYANNGELNALTIK